MANEKTNVLTNTKVEAKLYYLIDQAPSQFVKQGTEGTPFEVRLKAPSAYRYPSETTCVMDKDGIQVVRELRFITGCDTPFRDEQEQRGFRFDPNRDIIWFEHGQLAVVDSAYTRGLFLYLAYTSGNEESEYRNPNVPAKFREFKPVKEAARSIQALDLENEMVNHIMSLYKDKGGELVFEQSKIDFLCTLFSVHAMSYEQKIVGLVAIAKANPNNFKNTIVDQKNLYKVSILEAVDNGIISIEGKSASHIATNTPFLTFEGRNKEDKLEELMKYLVSEDGDQMFKQMQIEMRAKKDTMLNSVV